jgi:hypothetical protein
MKVTKIFGVQVDQSQFDLSNDGMINYEKVLTSLLQY